MISENDNRPVVAAEDVYHFGDEASLIVSTPAGLLANDSSPNADAALRAQLLVAPTHGELTLETNGSFTYHPRIDFPGSDQFSYVAVSNDGTSDITSVSVTGVKCHRWSKSW